MRGSQMPSKQNSEDIDFSIGIGSGFKRVRGFLRMTPIDIDHSSTPGGAKDVSVIEEILPVLPEVFPEDELLDQETSSPSDIFINKSFFNIYSIIVAQDGTGDFESIQEALDNLASTGGTVFIKEGTYAENLTLSSNIALVGQGFSSYIDGTISATSESAIVIRNLRFEKISFNTVSDLKILNNFVSSQTSTPIILTAVTKALLSGNIIDTVTGATSIGINIGNNSSEIIISNNIIKSCGLHGINFTSGSGDKFSIIENNQIVSCKIGILATNSAESVIISDNISRNNSDVGIQAEDSSSRIIISGNQALSNTNYGIRFLSVDRCIGTSNIALGNGTNFDVTTSTNMVTANNITA